MGVSVSKNQSVLLDNCEDAGLSSPPSSSPPSSSSSRPARCILPRELDPRSPSAGIDRTPIQVTPRVAAVVKPVSLVDPRSPTVGIDRTPIVCYSLKPGDVTPGAESELAKTVSLDCIPRFPEKDLDSSSSDVFHDADKSVTPPSLLSTEIEAAGLEQQQQPVTAVTTVATKPKQCISTAAGGNCTSITTMPPVPYSLSPASNKLFGSGSGGPRSPLAQRNFVGPRAASTPHGLVRRKQAFHVERLRSTDSPRSASSTIVELQMPKRQQQYYESSCDKENM